MYFVYCYSKNRRRGAAAARIFLVTFLAIVLAKVSKLQFIPVVVILWYFLIIKTITRRHTGTLPDDDRLYQYRLVKGNVKMRLTDHTGRANLGTALFGVKQVCFIDKGTGRIAYQCDYKINSHLPEREVVIHCNRNLVEMSPEMYASLPEWDMYSYRQNS